MSKYDAGVASSTVQSKEQHLPKKNGMDEVLQQDARANDSRAGNARNNSSKLESALNFKEKATDSSGSIRQRTSESSTAATRPNSTTIEELRETHERGGGGNVSLELFPQFQAQSTTVCIRQGQIMFPPWAERKNLSKTVSDEGGKRIIAINNEIVSIDEVCAINADLLIAWFTCEGNLHHMMEQTILPVVSAALEKDNHPYLAIYDSDYIQNPKMDISSGCHGPRYFGFLALLPIHCTVFSVQSSRREPIWSSSVGALRENEDPAFEGNKTYCFKDYSIVTPSDTSKRRDVEVLLQNYSQCETSLETLNYLPTNKTVSCVIIQRTSSRVIKNIDVVVKEAEKLCESVHVVELEGMSLQEQIASFLCEKRVVIAGVHGAGMAWSRLVPNAFIVEWGFGRWGIEGYYNNQRAAGYIYTAKKANEMVVSLGDQDGCYRKRDPNCKFPNKFDDVKIGVAQWSIDLSKAVRLLSETD